MIWAQSFFCHLEVGSEICASQRENRLGCFSASAKAAGEIVRVVVPPLFCLHVQSESNCESARTQQPAKMCLSK